MNSDDEGDMGSVELTILLFCAICLIALIFLFKEPIILFLGWLFTSTVK